jgi:hypothetical protein
MQEPAMTLTPAQALVVARPVLRGLTLLNALYALGISVLLASSFIRSDWPWVPLGFDLHAASSALPLGLRAIMVLGLAGAAIVHMILRRLRMIVDTVQDGDPFITDNARRLQAIAWGVLAIEALRLLVAALARAVSTEAQPIHMGGGFSFAPWLAVLLLFVLSGVFAQGARMREDLEGTV